MANLIIKPSTGGQLIIKDEGGDAAITVAAAGTTTFAENATLSGTANALGTVASGTLSTAIINANAPKVVFRGWNVSSNSSTGEQNWPLDTIVSGPETAYMTTAGTDPKVFTVVKAGMYYVHLKCMSKCTDTAYVHHQLKLNGTIQYATHGYGGSSTAHWVDYSFSHVFPLGVSDTLSGQSNGNSTTYVWYGGHYHSEFTIAYLGPVAA